MTTNSRANRLTAASLLLGVAGTSGAQMVNPTTSMPPSSQLRSGKALPAKTMPPVTKQLPGRTVTLAPVPAGMVQLEAVPGYPATRTENATATLAVVRSGLLQPNMIGCPPSNDRIALPPVLRNGYRLIEVRIKQTAQGTGGVAVAADDSPAFSGLDAAGNALPQAQITNFVTLIIRNPATAAIRPTIVGPAFCKSGYTVEAIVRGPRGIDPLTGANVPF